MNTNQKDNNALTNPAPVCFSRRLAALLAGAAIVGVTSVATLAQDSANTPNAQTTRTLSSAQLAERTIHRRAVEAVIWGVPAVNFDVMYQAMVRDTKAGEGSNKIVYWSRLFDWKNQTLTPNPDAIYLMAFYDTKDVGPVVLEIPPSGEGTIVGSIDDWWQTAIEDVGPAGADKGKGGKYLLLPPDFKGKAPPGYIALPSGKLPRLCATALQSKERQRY